MTDTLPAVGGLDRLEQLIGRLERLEQHAGIDTRVATDAYGNPGYVVPGELIESAWGNAVADHVVRVFPNAAALGTWTTPPEGALAITLDTATIWQRNLGWIPISPPKYILGSLTAGNIGIGLQAPTAGVNLPRPGSYLITYTVALASVAPLTGVQAKFFTDTGQAFYFNVPAGSMTGSFTFSAAVTVATAYSLEIHIVNGSTGIVSTYSDPASHQAFAIPVSV